jgi:hypothetical protein
VARASGGTRVVGVVNGARRGVGQGTASVADTGSSEPRQATVRAGLRWSELYGDATYDDRAVKELSK